MNGHLCPLPWSSSANGNFTASNVAPWTSMCSNYMMNNIEMQSDSITLLKQLVSFRRRYLNAYSNYLFHYVNGGQIVIERFSNRFGANLPVRFVLFANLGQTEKESDFSDKFQFGSIRLSTNPKRIQDFLYLRSLKLEAGEAIITKIE
jgi:hypothetical protein